MTTIEEAPTPSDEGYANDYSSEDLFHWCIEMIKKHDRWHGKHLERLEALEHRQLIEEGIHQVESDPARRGGPVHELDSALWGELREWRSATATLEGIKPFHVFGDRVLAAVVGTRPADKYALSHIKDFGPKRMERYADEVLAIVAKHTD